MEKIASFDYLHRKRKEFQKENRLKDHVVLTGRNNILISAPHGVSQVRLGKPKFSEIGSLTTALYLQNKTDCWLIAKTKNNNDDANFDENGSYKNEIKKLIQKHNIKYIIDIHGLGMKRDCDINLGTHLGHNIEGEVGIFNTLNKTLKDNGFKVVVDQPFMAGSTTISGSIKNEFPEVWTLQIEINCGITNIKFNYDKYKKLLEILLDWLNGIGK